MALNKVTSIEQEAQALLAPFGLSAFGWFHDDNKSGLLIGNIGSELWPSFSTSAEFSDGDADPLNRWTVRVMEPMARELQAELRYPFGEKIWPFQRYAKEATGVQQSPIGLLIHPEYGLWMAFRAALMFDKIDDLKHSDGKPHPCDSCADRPCLNTCPINAFTSDGYDYLSCKSHVASSAGRECYVGGCMARHACPVGKGFSYTPDHQAFHMKAYV